MHVHYCLFDTLCICFELNILRMFKSKQIHIILFSVKKFNFNIFNCVSGNGLDYVNNDNLSLMIFSSGIYSIFIEIIC